MVSKVLLCGFLYYRQKNTYAKKVWKSFRTLFFKLELLPIDFLQSNFKVAIKSTRRKIEEMV